MCLLTCGHIQHMYSWWWVGLSPETCRLKAFGKNKTQLLHLGIIFTVDRAISRWVLHVRMHANFLWVIPEIFVSVLVSSDCYNCLNWSVNKRCYLLNPRAHLLQHVSRKIRKLFVNPILRCFLYFPHFYPIFIYNYFGIKMSSEDHYLKICSSGC